MLGSSGINGSSTSLKQSTPPDSDSDTETAPHNDSNTTHKIITDSQHEHEDHDTNDTSSSENDQVYLVDGSEEDYESPPTPLGNGNTSPIVTSRDRINLTPSGDEDVIIISD